jgi:hypothetical protein
MIRNPVESFPSLRAKRSNPGAANAALDRHGAEAPRDDEAIQSTRFGMTLQRLAPMAIVITQPDAI